MKRLRNPVRMGGTLRRSPCPIANTLDLIGDKWTLLIVRDLLFFGKRQYRELAASPESIPSNILAERLKRLRQAGLIQKTPYQERPVRYAYALTASGAALKRVLLALIEWGNRHIPGTYRPTPAQVKIARLGESGSSKLRNARSVRVSKITSIGGAGSAHSPPYNGEP